MGHGNINADLASSTVYYPPYDLFAERAVVRLMGSYLGRNNLSLYGRASGAYMTTGEAHSFIPGEIFLGLKKGAADVRLGLLNDGIARHVDRIAGVAASFNAGSHWNVSLSAGGLADHVWARGTPNLVFSGWAAKVYASMNYRRVQASAGAQLAASPEFDDPVVRIPIAVLVDTGWHSTVVFANGDLTVQGGSLYDHLHAGAGTAFSNQWRARVHYRHVDAPSYFQAPAGAPVVVHDDNRGGLTLAYAPRDALSFLLSGEGGSRTADASLGVNTPYLGALASYRRDHASGANTGSISVYGLAFLSSSVSLAPYAEASYTDRFQITSADAGFHTVAGARLDAAPLGKWAKISAGGEHRYSPDRGHDGRIYGNLVVALDNAGSLPKGSPALTRPTRPDGRADQARQIRSTLGRDLIGRIKKFFTESHKGHMDYYLDNGLPVTCMVCHPKSEESPRKIFNVADDILKNTCSTCHGDESYPETIRTYSQVEHPTPRLPGKECSECHDESDASIRYPHTWNAWKPQDTAPQEHTMAADAAQACASQCHKGDVVSHKNRLIPSCESSCHDRGNVTQPAHRDGWSSFPHTLEAKQNADRCFEVCHQPDYCRSCHEVTPNLWRRGFHDGHRYMQIVGGEMGHARAASTTGQAVCAGCHEPGAWQGASASPADQSCASAQCHGR